MRCTIASPRPVPRPNEPRNGWKMASTSSAGMPVPSSRTPMLTEPSVRHGEQLEPPATRHRLQTVGGEVPDDLPQLILVGVEPHRRVGHRDVDAVVRQRLGARAQQARRFPRTAPARVDAGDTSDRARGAHRRETTRSWRSDDRIRAARYPSAAPDRRRAAARRAAPASRPTSRPAGCESRGRCRRPSRRPPRGAGASAPCVRSP